MFDEKLFVSLIMSVPLYAHYSVIVMECTGMVSDGKGPVKYHLSQNIMLLLQHAIS